jgi:hypothetical protein
VRGQIKSPFIEKGFSPMAHPNNCALNVEGVYRQMRNGERTNKSSTYGKRLQSEDINYFSGHNFGTCNSASPNCLKATGNRQQATGNRQLYT